MFPVLETNRLLLRKFKMTDAKIVQRLAGDKEVYDTTLNIPYPYLDGMAEKWIEGHQDSYQEKISLVFAIVLKEKKKLIGAISLVFLKYNKAEIGYWVGKEYWNRGYCTEAGIALNDFAFKEMGLNKVIGRHLVINPSSGKVMQKIGMKKEGILEDDVIKDGFYHDIAYYGITYKTWIEEVEKKV